MSNRLDKFLDEIYDEAALLDLSLRDLESLSGLSYSTVWRLQNRLTPTPRLNTVVRLAEAVGLEFVLEKTAKGRRKSA
jgi:transcriptional regulator with XRE-family HTH domain